MKINQTVKAVLVSPWASVVVVLFALIQDLLALNLNSMTELGPNLMSTVFLFFLFVLVFVGISYLIVAFIGLPAHWLLSKLELKHWSYYIVCGVAIALASQFLLFIGSDVPSKIQIFGYISYGFSAVFVSLVFWYIAVSSQKNILRSIQSPD